jgi:hypothetical protein
MLLLMFQLNFENLVKRDLDTHFFTCFWYQLSTTLHAKDIFYSDMQGVCSSFGTICANDIFQCEEFYGSSSPSMQELSQVQSHLWHQIN